MSIGRIDIIKWVIELSRLRELREEKGYTQIKMQMLTGIDQSDYSKIENGKRYFTLEQLKRIAIVLETSMDYLAGLTDERKPYPRRKE
ncbi:helix-turn-helix domain-containing protein [Agathobaculum massiliense]|uniref:helix-turn-helix domain-containing protein n=2 Tax=Butyricicoccaceae TaxID=3085642 RepID=UPI0036F3419E